MRAEEEKNVEMVVSTCECTGAQLEFGEKSRRVEPDFFPFRTLSTSDFINVATILNKVHQNIREDTEKEECI